MVQNDHIYRELSLDGQAHDKAADRITGKMESIETEDAFIEGFLRKIVIKKRKMVIDSGNKI